MDSERELVERIQRSNRQWFIDFHGPIPTGNDYDVRMTVHTASQGACSGSYSLYARSTPDNTTAYVLTIDAGTIGLFPDAVRGLCLLAPGQGIGRLRALCPKRHRVLDHLHLRCLRAYEIGRAHV